MGRRRRKKGESGLFFPTADKRDGREGGRGKAALDEGKGGMFPQHIISIIAL